MSKIQDFISNLKQKSFIQSIINDLRGETYVVGGATRDLILNKPNKDIDLIIRKVPIDALITQLQKFGRVDVVGKSFGVIKFIDSDGTDYDLALPRKEQPTGEGGYRGFDVQSDENLPIEDDLIRRDCKMNAMAININTGKFIDPLGGLEDIKSKQISAANPNAFSDDPLRMIRMVAFASRFGFDVEPNTMKLIQDNASRVREIAPERILTEFDKIIKKGNITTGVELLMNSGLYAQIFPGKPQKISGLYSHVKTMGEFIYLLSNSDAQNPSEFYKNNLKGDIPTYKEIKALELAFGEGDINNPIMARSVAHNMYLLSPQALLSQIIPKPLQIASQELLQGKYPKTVNELAVNGDDLMKLGLQGKAIGDMQKSLLLKIYADKVKNSKEDLLNFAKQHNPGDVSTIKEEKNINRIEYSALLLFLNIPVWNKITSLIDEEDIYNEPGYGIETEPHVTILYGFHDDINAKEVFDIVKKTIELKPINVYITGISAFENPEFDVVKFDVVKSDELMKLNNVMKELPNTSDFPVYHPHITIAYVKPGEGQEYTEPFEKERMFKGTKLVFSTKGHIGQEGDVLNLSEDNSIRVNEVYQYPELSSEQKPTWNVNGQNVDINFFTDQYYQWNQGAYDVTTTKSVQEFLDNQYPNFGNDEKLKHDLYHKLVDNEVLDEDMKKNVSYSAVVLDKDARFRLVERYKRFIPQNFEILAHHMTINMGEIDPEYVKYLGMSVNLTVEEIAMDDKVVAVGVSGFYSKNPKPHITLAVNTFEGGKPKMSNNLTNWEKVKRPLTISGKVTEVKYYN